MPKHCSSEKPHLLGPEPVCPSSVAVSQPGFPQGEGQGKYPQILRWTWQPADILSFVPTITQQDENDEPR